MEKSIATKTYTHEPWQIRFEYPNHWLVGEELSGGPGALAVYSPQSDNGARPGMNFELIDDSTAADLPALVENVLKALQKVNDNLKVIKQLVRADRKAASVLVYQYSEQGTNLLSQKVIIPLPGKKCLAVTATTETSVWPNYAKLFQGVVASISLLPTTSKNDVEITFTEPSAAKKTSLPPVKASEKRAVLSMDVPPPVLQGTDSLRTVAAQFDNRWKYCAMKEELIEILGDEAMAKVLWAALGGTVKSWLSDSISALNDRTPLECVKTPHGREALKQLLLQVNSQADNLGDVAAKINGFHVDDNSSVEELFRIPTAARNQAWYSKLFRAALNAHFYVSDNPIQVSPDGFPYYCMHTSMQSQNQTPRHLMINEVVDYVTSEGVGIAIYPPEGEGWGWSFGQACHLRLRGVFYDPADRNTHQPPKSLPGAGVLVGQPTEDILPSDARRVLKAFMQQAFQIKQPAVYLECDPAREVSQTIMFNLLDRSWASEDQLHDALRALSWFLFPFIGLGAQSHKQSKNFEDL